MNVPCMMMLVYRSQLRKGQKLPSEAVESVQSVQKCGRCTECGRRQLCFLISPSISFPLYCFVMDLYIINLNRKKITNFDSQVIASILKRRGVEHRDNRLTDFCRQDIKGI